MPDLNSLTVDEKQLLPLAVALEIRRRQIGRGHKQLLYPLPDCHVCASAVTDVLTVEPYTTRETVLKPCGHKVIVSDDDAQVLGEYAHGIATDIENAPAGTVKPGWAGLIQSLNAEAAPSQDIPQRRPDRREQYAEAVNTIVGYPSDTMVNAVMAVADREIKQLRDELDQLTRRLDLAHQARRAKEHQLDGIRRALCDTGAMRDDDPYSHADLEDVIRQAAAGPQETT